MLFNSISYLIFLPIVFVAYWLAQGVWRKVWLLVASYLFYMSWLPTWGLLILFMTQVNFVLGIQMDKHREKKKAILTAGLLFNILLLCFFKYTNFVLGVVKDALNSVLPIFGTATAPQMPYMDLIVPLGISFFAFEFIHYLMDIHRGSKPITSWLDFAIFAAFFPSQIAGPIKRYRDFVGQLTSNPVLNREHFHEGLSLIMQGLFKKLALADNMGLIIAQAYQNVSTLGTLEAWLVTYMFIWQIYFDFSGYTDLGRGSARLLGFKLPDNFDWPLFPSNLIDFWRRWHISLSTWLRDYLFLPLARGAKKSKVRKYFATFITMSIGGLWHGAAWNFVMWGAFHGVGLVICQEYNERVRGSKFLTDLHKTRPAFIVSWLLTTFFCQVGCILFRAETLPKAWAMFCHMFTAAPSGPILTKFLESPVPAAALVYALYVVAFGNWVPEHWYSWKRFQNIVLQNTPARVAVYCGSFLAAFAFCLPRNQPFIYFQF